jgi:ribosome biogenesis GTPase
MNKKRKIRVDLRKNRYKPPREHGWTREYHRHGFEDDATVSHERVRAKGDLSRKRTIISEAASVTPSGDKNLLPDMPVVDIDACLTGRVLRVQGLHSLVATADGRLFRCAVRRLLRNLVIDERNIIATGDQVWIRPAGKEEGVIERVEPRHGLLTRASRGKEQLIVVNVDQLVIVASLAEPDLKPHLIDRYLVSAEKGHIQPIICLNKADLVDPADYQWLVGMYCQLGIPVLLTSVEENQGIDRFRELLRGKQTVFAGQSGVGKSSLLNAIQPGLDLKVAEVSTVNQKGKHTTTTAELLPLEFGGWVVDTPGVRQFALWDLIPDQIEGYFPEFRPYVPQCRYPDCTHMQEDHCAILSAVRRRRIPYQRYDSYRGLFSGQTLD